MSENKELDQLVSALSDKKISQVKIHKLCEQLKIPFNGDVVELMSYLLTSDHLKSQIMKPKTKNQNVQKKKKSNEVYI